MDEKAKNAEANGVKAVSGAAPAKSFMTAGPTLHYSHTNVLWLWGLSIVVFLLASYFWFQLMPVAVATQEKQTILEKTQEVLIFQLGDAVNNPISIYEYPWHIVVLGILMGILAVGPVLISQLLSFRFSIPLVLSIIFIAKLPLFGLFVLISCIAVACRPLRFRSRFISLALCMAPQLIYWAVWGGYPTSDPVRWGFSFAPWIYAWLSALAMAGIILGIGHFTRYKPGLNWLISMVFLAIAYGVFQRHIGFSELDYQRYIANNDPSDAVEFQDQSISETLDKVLADPSERSRLEGQFFESDSSESLRLKLKGNIQDMLIYNNRWPGWFRKKMPNRLQYQIKQPALILEYENYINHWSNNRKRLPTVMYFRSILSEMRPDVRDIVDDEMLRFYSDYPFPDNNSDWRALFEEFPESPESIEARWRIAMSEAANRNFEKAEEICQTSLLIINEEIKALLAATEEKSNSIFEAFRKPTRTVMTPFKLHDLENRFRKLMALININNRDQGAESFKRLAEFIMLNPYDEHNYIAGLNGLLEKTSPKDGLRDNILLAKAMLVDDIDQRLKLLEDLAEKYPKTDGGIQAYYEQGMTKIKLWKNIDGPEEAKKQLLIDSRKILSDVIEKYPDFFFCDLAREMLETLPQP